MKSATPSRATAWKMRLAAVLVGAAWVAGAPLWADVIVFRDSDRRVEGMIIRETDDAVVLRTANSEFRIRKSQIKEIIRSQDESEEEKIGDEFARRNQLAEALQHYRAALASGLSDERVREKIRTAEAAMQAGQQEVDAEALKEARQAAKQGQYPKAIKTLEEVLAKLPEGDARREALKRELAQTHYDHAQAMKDMVRKDAAASELRKAIELDPGFRAAYLELAELLLRDNPRAVPEAKELYAKGFASDTPALPAQAEALYRFHWAEAQFQNKEYAAAVKNFNVVIRSGLAREVPLAVDRVIKAYSLIGRDQIKKEDLEDTIKAMSKAVADDPRQTQAHFFLGQVYSDLGRWKEAADTFRTLLELDKSYREAHLMLARSYKELGNLEGYRHELESELAINPWHYEALCLLAENSMTGAKYQDALDRFDAALQANEAPVRAHLGRAEALRKLRRFDEARLECETVISRDPKSPDPLFIRGNVEMDQKQYDVAAADFQKMVEMIQAKGEKQRSPAEKGLLAQAYWKIGEAALEMASPNQARDNLQKAVELNPDLAEAYHDLAKAHVALGEIEKAEDCYVTALEKEPNEPDFYLGLAFLYHRNFERPQDALPFYLKYLELGGRDRDKVEDHVRECGGDPSQKAQIDVPNLRRQVRQKRLASGLAISAVPRPTPTAVDKTTSPALASSVGAANAPASGPIASSQAASGPALATSPTLSLSPTAATAAP